MEKLSQYEHKNDTYLVSKTVPLISNLNVAENISLLLEYHRAIATKEALEIVYKRLDIAGVLDVASKREPHISTQNRFTTMLIRASILGGNIIIERPFLILENDKSADFMNEILDKINGFYSRVTILDFSWNKERYGELNV